MELFIESDSSNTAPSTLHVPNMAPFSHHIMQQPYATVFYSVICAKMDLRRLPSSLWVGLVLMYGNTIAGVGVGGVLLSGSSYMCPTVQCVLCSENVYTAHCMKQ